MIVPELPLLSSTNIFLGHKGAHKKKSLTRGMVFPLIKKYNAIRN